MRVLVVEDEAPVRSRLEAILGGEPGIDLLGACSSANEALERLRCAPRPDVVLVDLGLPDMSGVELIGRIKEHDASIELLVYTVFDVRDTIFTALRAGASGYILKGATSAQLVEALREVHGGGAPMSPRVARSVLSHFRDERDENRGVLSRREREIVERFDAGRSCQQVADDLGVSIHTVHTHCKRIYEKLHVKSRGEALAQARQRRLI